MGDARERMSLFLDLIFTAAMTVDCSLGVTAKKEIVIVDNETKHKAYFTAEELRDSFADFYKTHKGVVENE